MLLCSKNKNKNKIKNKNEMVVEIKQPKNNINIRPLTPLSLIRDLSNLSIPPLHPDAVRLLRPDDVRRCVYIRGAVLCNINQHGTGRRV